MGASVPSEHDNRITIEGVEIALGFPDEFAFEWIGQQDVMDQLLAAWLVIDAEDIPLNPSLSAACHWLRVTRHRVWPSTD